MPKKSATPSVIDVFAGVGGLSLGAARAGFNVAAAVEIDERAVAAHHINFPRTHLIPEDVSGISSSTLLTKAGLKPGELAGLIGGPPCQGFSSIGRRVADDPRNSLFETFFRLVETLKPAFFLAENVPGILHERNDTVRDRALSTVPKNYVLLDPIKVRASEYGAPTTRTRMFFIGFDPKKVRELSHDDFQASPDIQDVRVMHALAGIPDLGAVWESGNGQKKVRTADTSHFGTRLHDCIPDGVGDIESIKLLQNKNLASGFLSTIHNPETIKRFRILDVGMKDPVSKSVRLNPKGYCPTLRAGTGPEKGSYQAVRPIHPGDPRVICPREAARLQGFPDWFQFDQTKWHAFRQIGNSVSPIVAERILSKIWSALR
ncbi:DNA cytosine methyltransferase [Burkholderia anthina]|uniref:DNA cytosine methyltransferase n=1 Tax=Burkholderia anthina TaxID=179879 RepID=UPI001AA07E0D|nr:DNA cytosine methyltransferase [Burkholderia anthina]QTD89823.1 DNA cytosine methyltransferase [Burkholderia anthina]